MYCKPDPGVWCAGFGLLAACWGWPWSTSIYWTPSSPGRSTSSCSECEYSCNYNWCIDNRLSDNLKWRYIWQNAGNLHYIITHNVIWANQKTKSFVCHWLHTIAMFDITYFPAIVGATDVISKVLLIRLLRIYCWFVGYYRIWNFLDTCTFLFVSLQILCIYKNDKC